MYGQVMLGQIYIIYVYLTFYYSTVFAFYTGEVHIGDYNNKIEGNNPQWSRRKKINAVLFFAETAAGEDYHNFSGLSCLKLEKKPEIKHCTDYPRSILSRKKRYWRFKKETCICYRRLQEGLMSLLNYAQNELGMVTALGSLSNNSFSNSIRYGNTEIQMNDRIETNEEERKPESAPLEANKPSRHNEELFVDTNYPSLSSAEEEQYRKIPLLNVFPKDSPPPFYVFTGEEERIKRSQGPYVEGPEHTEVFKIRTKRDMPVSKPQEISDATYLNQEPKVKTIFDIMDILSNLQRSLFGNMLQDDSDMFMRERDSCPMQNNMFKKIRQPGLFEVVQKTLYSVINASDSGFLMVIVGGNLSDVSSAYSPLVQSIKHISENTDEDSTLIVLTATCPNSPEARVKLSCEELNKQSLPLFAVGPGSDEFSNCYELYDIPITVKRILAKYNSKNREVQPQELEPHSRTKRNIMDMLEDEEEDYYEDEYFHIDDKRAARVTGGAGREKSLGNGCSMLFNPHIKIYIIFIVESFIYYQFIYL
ncbi:hypothetical protein WA026_011952 [Henosepilachna vigintioctopunctata]|uniref:VWFA domain-containing protein n=1 Tax=Henosepilachna vigintioctopunctata TaxID=420089 RepID=A0AAW1VF23_9CUCU